MDVDGPPAAGDRLAMVVVGAVALGLYSGFIVGPLLALVAAALPARVATWPKPASLMEGRAESVGS